jgi:hypothetical protein
MKNLKMGNPDRTGLRPPTNKPITGENTPAPGSGGHDCSSPQKLNAGQRQFQQFIDAANHLGSHMRDTFDDAFLQIVLNRQPDVSASAQMQVPSKRLSGNITSIEAARSWNRRQMISQPLDEPLKEQASSIEASMIVRLHFTEAMMVLLFNALGEKQQSSIKEQFGNLLKKVENLEILGTPPATLHAYREALSAMHKMLASNPEPEELAVALGDDFSKRFRS